MATLGLNDYQDCAKRTDQNQNDGMQGLGFALLGLFGEVGTLLSALKKVRRDGESYVGYDDAVIEEFGDVLWYFSNIASRASLNLSILAQRVLRDIHDWDDVEIHHFGTFGDIQSQSEKDGSVSKSEKFEKALIALSGKVGLLMNDFSLAKISTNRDILSAHLVEIFRALIEAADVAEVSLQNAAIQNLHKTESRWPRERNFTPLFDDGLDVLQQLPRKMEIHLYEVNIGRSNQGYPKWNGVNIGDPLTDNKQKEDDYRFHDVFHLAYAAILGWSPILRRSLKVKRKGNSTTDENQDGARAAFIEEGLSALIFQRALQLDNFRAIKSLGLFSSQTHPGKSCRGGKLKYARFGNGSRPYLMASLFSGNSKNSVEE